MPDAKDARPQDGQLEAFTDFGAQQSKVRAGFRTQNAEWLAGGPIEVEFVVENTGEGPFYLALGSDRARMRPAFFSFSATLTGTAGELGDPAEQIPALGGPATVRTIANGDSFSQILLVNGFVRLEQLTDTLAPGSTSLLQLRCRRLIPLADTAAQAFQTGPGAPEVDVLLTVTVRRDDSALEALVTRLANEIRDSKIVSSSPEAERALAQLVTLRAPLSLPSLQALLTHPDQTTRMRVQQAVSHLQRSSP